MSKTLWIVLLFATALSAQNQPALQCVANAAVPPTIRAEGLTELIGDIVLNCSGASVVTSGRLTQFDVSLLFNTQVTSFKLANGFSEAAILVDEPSSLVLCTTPATGCTGTIGASGNPNVVPGVVQGNQITFQGVPVNAPVPTKAFIFRIANVRVNATSLSGGSLTSAISVTQQNGSPALVSLPAFPVKPGLISTFQPAGFPNGTIPFAAPGVQVPIAVHFQEGFTNAWDQHLGHPLSVLPGSGTDSPTRISLNFSSVPNGVTLFVPTNVQSPFVFLPLTDTTSGPGTSLTANTTLNSAPAFTQNIPQSGTCTLSFYGSGPTNFDPVAVGQVRSFDTGIAVSLTSITPTPGFQGYLIAQASFQNSQGFVFQPDPAQNLIAPGYLKSILSLPLFAPNTTIHGVSPASRLNPAAATSLPILTSVNSASFSSRVAVAGDALVSGFSATVGTSDQGAASTPLPTTLGGISVRMTDAAGKATLLGLVHVNSGQVNYLLPTGLATVVSILEVMNGSTVVSAGALDVIPVAPGLFSANSSGTGIAAGQALLVSGSTQTPANISQVSGGKSVAVPLDLGVAGQSIFLILYGTGFRHVSGVAGATCQVGGLSVPVGFAGAQGGFLGLDQLNIGPMPVALAGKGEVPVQCVFDGAPANAVTVAFK